MRALPGLILRFVCSLALMLSALPIRAGVVCVVDRHVVATCERPCCAPKTRTRCEVVYRKTGTVVASIKAVVALPSYVPSEASRTKPFIEAVLAAIHARIALDDAPVSAQPRPPDRGRAPPSPSRSLSSKTR